MLSSAFLNIIYYWCIPVESIYETRKCTNECETYGCLISVFWPGVSQSMFAEKSSPEEWEKRGDEIMQRSLYDVAAKCYAMAGATHKQNIAIAHQRVLKASRVDGQPRQLQDDFLKAAILFLEWHRELVPSSSTLALRYNLVMKAGRCLQNARENHLAAMVFEKNGQVMPSVRFWETFLCDQSAGMCCLPGLKADHR